MKEKIKKFFKNYFGIFVAVLLSSAMILGLYLAYYFFGDENKRDRKFNVLAASAAETTSTMNTSLAVQTTKNVWELSSNVLTGLNIKSPYQNFVLYENVVFTFDLNNQTVTFSGHDLDGILFITTFTINEFGSYSFFFSALSSGCPGEMLPGTVTVTGAYLDSIPSTSIPYSIDYYYVGGNEFNVRFNFTDGTEYYRTELSFDFYGYTSCTNIYSPYFRDEITNQFKTEYFDIEDYSKGYDDGYKDAQSNLRDEIENEVLQTPETFKDFIFAIVDAPLEALRTAFNFEIFGINVSSVLLFLLTAVIVFFVFKQLRG